MAPLPKRKISRARARKKRAHHALGRPQLQKCPTPGCDAYILPHRGCMQCGEYRGHRFLEEGEEDE